MNWRLVNELQSNTNTAGLPKLVHDLQEHRQRSKLQWKLLVFPYGVCIFTCVSMVFRGTDFPAESWKHAALCPCLGQVKKKKNTEKQTAIFFRCLSRELQTFVWFYRSVVFKAGGASPLGCTRWFQKTKKEQKNRM